MSIVHIMSSYKGQVWNGDDNYYTCRNADVGLYSVDTFSIFQMYVPAGQYGDYLIGRGFLYFDTSEIPDNAIITEATITTPSIYQPPPINFNIIIRGANSASNPPVVGDYKLTYYDGENLGELTVPNQYLSWTLNSNGYLYINKGGLTKFIFLSEEDIDNDPPTGDESALYVNTITLNVTYFEPTETPTLTTVDTSCKDRQSTTLTATGNITNAGGGYTYRGFEYYEYTATDKYASEMYAVREIGRFVDTGEFEMTLYGLKPATIYYIRAYAGNVFGIFYGEWVLCMTTEVPSYDIYTTTNTAKYRLYVSDDEAIAWRGYKGPYSGKMTLINITDITNKTKGVKVLKILPDSKGNFHVCITVKEEIKS